LVLLRELFSGNGNYFEITKKFNFTYIFILVRKLDSDNLTETKKWNGINEIIETLAGYTLYDHKTNDSIRRELQITCILDKTDEYRLNWLLHLQRMPQNRIPLKSYHYRPQGRRTIGRPKKRWREQL
jgi:hypothetical protein